MSRTTTYPILFLLAVVLTILPAAMWPDMVIPMSDAWENWYWKGQPHPRPELSLDNPPALLRAEVASYKALVSPAAYAKRAVTGWPTAYASFFVQPYVETAGVPPLAMALEHTKWSLPLWFVCFALLFELARGLRRRLSSRVV